MKSLALVLAVSQLLLCVSSECIRPTYCGRPAVSLLKGMKKSIQNKPLVHPKPLKSLNGTEMTLLQVQSLQRHGARSPHQADKCWADDDASFDCDMQQSSLYLLPHQDGLGRVPRLYKKVYAPDIEPAQGNCAVGQLTTFGNGQQADNGFDYRRAYVETGFLSETLNRDELSLRSTDVGRTLQSVSAFASDLYQLFGESRETTQVVAIHTRDLSVEDMIPQGSAWTALAAQATSSAGYKSLTAPYLPIYKRILSQIDTNVTSMSVLMDCFNTHLCSDRSIPVPQADYDVVVQGVTAAQYYVFNYPTPQRAAQVGLGSYFKTVHERLTAAIDGSNPTTKLYVDVGHDASVMLFLSGLQAADGLWASYAVYTTLELYRVESEQPSYAVRFLYRGHPVQLPYCAQLVCTWAEFDAYVSTLLPPAGTPPLTADRSAAPVNPDLPMSFVF